MTKSAVVPKLAQGVKRNFDATMSFSDKFSKRVANHNIADLVFIEIFSGTAGLTAAVRRMGCKHSTGVDAHVTKQVKSPVIRIDLATVHGQELLWRILQQPRVFAIHLGPPCGTSSRAREIKRRFGPNPKPLRSTQFPDGLPNLPPRDQARVDTANILYGLSGKIMRFATQTGILCTLENPKRSHMWQTSYLQDAIRDVRDQLHQVHFHHCMFGSTRAKNTQLLVNHQCFDHLNRPCDQSHQHEAWGHTQHGWATALEVEYPTQLCREWAACLQAALLQNGATAPPCELLQDTSMNINLQAKAALGVQVRGKRLRPLMREFSYTMSINGPESVITKLPKVTTSDVILPPSCTTKPIALAIPAHAKQTKAPILQGESAGRENTWQVEYGIPWEPSEFVKRASGLSHPGHFLDGVHEVLADLFRRMASSSPHAMAQDRTASMRKWSMRFSELKSAGYNGLERAPLHCKKILQNKNMILFSEMVKESQSPDKNIADDITKGFDLMGPMPAGGIFLEKPLHATLLPQQVRDMAHMAREATWCAVKRTKDNDLCQEIYDATVEECNRGWLRGPVSFDKLPEKAVLTRRFGVKQSSTLSDGSKVMKFRPIDDFSESLINVTNSCSETIQPMGVDQICAALVRRMQTRPSDQLVCKTIDLRKAYKNLPISEDALQDAYIAVFSPSDGVPQAFQSLVLPFGARAAVMGFCRTSYAIWRIGVVIFGLHWTVYFDDYFLVAEIHQAKHVDMAQQLLFMILGWETSDEKEGGFNHISRILGVQINLADAHLGAAVISNVESRVRELVCAIDGILTKGSLTTAEMRVLRGRLVFAEAQIFGRLTGIHMKQLSRFENLVGDAPVDNELKRSLIFLRDRVLCGEPRKLLSAVGRVYHLYTDACYEDGSGGLGGVLFDENGQMLSFFSETLSPEWVKLINPTGKKGMIFELETLATALGVTQL